MWWVNLLTFVGFIGLGTFLVWPLSMFGKDKLYIYIGRAIKFKIKNQFYQCEKS
jgi:hypothetical protein